MNFCIIKSLDASLLLTICCSSETCIICIPFINVILVLNSVTRLLRLVGFFFLHYGISTRLFQNVNFKCLKQKWQIKPQSRKETLHCILNSQAFTYICISFENRYFEYGRCNVLRKSNCTSFYIALLIRKLFIQKL